MKTTVEAIRERIAALEAAEVLSIKEGLYLNALREMLRLMDDNQRLRKERNAALKQLVAAQDPDERVRFEAFMEGRFGESIDQRRAKNGDQEYMAWDKQVAWITWQQRALPVYTASPAQPVAVPILAALRRLSSECDTGERRKDGSQSGVAMPSREAVEVARAALAYIDALPADVVACLPTMPGFSRDWAEEVLEAAQKQPVSATYKLVGEVVAWNGPQRQGVHRTVDFRWIDIDVPPGTKLYAMADKGSDSIELTKESPVEWFEALSESPELCAQLTPPVIQRMAKSLARRKYPVIPDGWQVVPKVLTPEMQDAWDRAPNGAQAEWSAMLNVSPSPAKGGE